MNNKELRADLKELADATLTYITGPRRTTGYSYDRLMAVIRRRNVQIVLGLKAGERVKGRRAIVPPGLIENLAALEHKQWAMWTRYMLNNLSPENIERWTRQGRMVYKDLTEAEKESDRMFARIMIQEILDYNEGEM